MSDERTLNHFAMFSFNDLYWSLSPEEQRQLDEAWLAGLREAARQIHIYQVFPMACKIRSSSCVMRSMTLRSSPIW